TGTARPHIALEDGSLTSSVAAELAGSHHVSCGSGHGERLVADRVVGEQTGTGQLHPAVGRGLRLDGRTGDGVLGRDRVGRQLVGGDRVGCDVPGLHGAYRDLVRRDGVGEDLVGGGGTVFDLRSSGHRYDRGSVDEDLRIGGGLVSVEYLPVVPLGDEVRELSAQPDFGQRYRGCQPLFSITGDVLVSD